MDAFDADVLIYASVAGHSLGLPVRRLFDSPPTPAGGAAVGVGSVLLLPELLTEPRRSGARDEVESLLDLLSRLHLLAVDKSVARLAVSLGATYGLRATDATHLATAVSAGATRFITNNSKDFSRDIAEIEVTYPSDLSGTSPA